MFKRLLKNWRTAVPGILGIVGMGFKIAHGGFDPTNDIPLIMGNIGLLSAKVNTVTGGTTSQDGGTMPLDAAQRPAAAGGSKP